MRRPNHCIEGEIKGDLPHPSYSGLCKQKAHQIKLISPTQKRSDIANANRRPAHFSSFMFIDAKLAEKRLKRVAEKDELACMFLS